MATDPSSSAADDPTPPNESADTVDADGEALPHVSGDQQSAHDEVAELSETDRALLELTAERDQFKDIALRLQADFENFRKRIAKDNEHATHRATEKLAGALLPVLDACEAAFLQHPSEIEPVFNLMLSELKKHGLEALNLQDQPFNPEFAEAVLHEPSDDATEPTVSEVLRSGYTWQGKVLRPAMVKVKG